MKKQWLLLIPFVALVLVFQNCGQSHGPDAGSYDIANTANVVALTKIEAEKSIGLACREDSDCQSIPAGAKACGGPTHYFVFSKSSSDVARIQKLADQMTELERKQIESSGGMSTCEFMMPPTLACIEARCEGVAR